MNEKLLEDIGLTKGEIKVYLTLLRIGETTTGKIIEEAQISSGKIYEILEKLIRKGLASYIIKEKTKYFIASSPNRILDYLREKEKDLQKKEQELTKELPLFSALEKSAKKEYEVTLFRGFKGYQTAIFETLNSLNSKDEVLVIGVTSKKPKSINILWSKWHKERIKRKIMCKLLFSEKNTEYYRYFRKMKYTEVKIIRGLTPAAADVMGNRVLILTHVIEPSCLSIKHPDIVQSFTTFFYNLWNMAKE